MTGEYRVQVTGLKELQRALKAFDADLPKEIKAAFLEIARGVSTEAAGRVPRKSGRAAASVKPHGTQKGAYVSGGGTAIPYYPWLDFGGGKLHARGVQPGGSGVQARRPFLSTGRYIFPAVKARRAETMEAAMDALRKSVTGAGLGWEER